MEITIGTGERLSGSIRTSRISASRIGLKGGTTEKREKKRLFCSCSLGHERQIDEIFNLQK